ncbi:hypothetical protein BEN78_05440 [Xanthomonas citri pv. mangiferaeindicae]|nr:hypothetical protein BEN78_05440 [Xanthomonas citri pv. mangiferaeindicae]
MTLMWRLSGVALVMLSVPACGEAEPAFLATDDPYVGTLDVRATPSNGRPAMRASGEGSIAFKRMGGDRVQLIVHGEVAGVPGQDAGAGNAGFIAEGRVGPEGWHAEAGGIRIDIDAQGQITGGGTVQQNRYGLSGRLMGSQGTLVVAIEPGATRAAGPGAEMSRFRFTYELERRQVRGDGTRMTVVQRGQGNCPHVVYQPRMIANIGSGAMSTVQVPVYTP